MPDVGRTITRALLEHERGAEAGADELLTLVYDELRRLAQSRMDREPAAHTLEATGLVHEAYLKLVDQTSVHWKGRTHFFCVAAEAMRRILIDHARARGAQKRGAGRRVEFPDDAAASPAPQAELQLAVVELLDALASSHPRPANVAQMRLLGGMNVDDVATELGISPRTVKTDWRFARAWLEERLAR